jgi:hypothetical protein
MRVALKPTTASQLIEIRFACLIELRELAISRRKAISGSGSGRRRRGERGEKLLE